MKLLINLLVIILMAFGAHAQNAISTNEIFKTEDNLFGVKSQNGKVLIDAIYKEIRIAKTFEKLVLPPVEGRPELSPLGYYLVKSTNQQKALFDSNGKLIFAFTDCSNLVFDQHTQTVVKATQAGSYLYNIKGELLTESPYKKIAFINHSDLIVLIAAEGSNKEFYLYNPFERKKIGPFDHFNVYNAASPTPWGIEPTAFDNYKKLNIIAVRREVDNDYLWGVIDIEGHEVLPMEYRNLKLFSKSQQEHPAYKQATKPEGVEFLFRGAHLSKPSTSIYFDRKWTKYEFKTIEGETRSYRIEKM